MMTKIIFSIIFGLVFVSSVTITANAQSLYVDSRIGDMSMIEESKYLASAITVTRNSEGELISVVRTDAARYLNEPIIDAYLNSNSNFLIKQGTINNEMVKMYQEKVGYYNPECLTEVFNVPGQTDLCNWYHRAFVTMLGVNDENGKSWNLFRGLNHMFLVKGLDDVTSFWTILVKN